MLPATGYSAFDSQQCFVGIDIGFTSLNCDADGLLERYYRRIMGDKISLLLEFDEQHANTGHWLNPAYLILVV